MYLSRKYRFIENSISWNVEQKLFLFPFLFQFEQIVWWSKDLIHKLLLIITSEEVLRSSRAKNSPKLKEFRECKIV